MRRWYRASCAGCGARFRAVTVGRLESRIIRHRCWAATGDAHADRQALRGQLFRGGVGTGATWPGRG